MTYTYICPHCETHTDCNFTPSRPAPSCSNHDSPAFSDPGDGAEIDLNDECPSCGAPINTDKVLEDAEEYAQNNAQ